MSFAIFDETYYLAHNPDVKAAVDSKLFTSGLEHFQKIGLQERRVSVSPLYSEQFYLENNPDVAQAVAIDAIGSGLAHFIQNGEAEGRFTTSPKFKEQLYLRANPDVAQAVAAGSFSSGLSHFVQFGQTEGRWNIFFNEDLYLAANPDVVSALLNGSIVSGFQHYKQFGQLEGRIGTFSGTNGSDIVTGFGKSTVIYGIDIGIGPADGIEARSLGKGEIDILTGGPGSDRFMLGLIDPVSGTAYSLYTGDTLKQTNPGPEPDYMSAEESKDHAIIRNFEVGKDSIFMGESRILGHNAIFNYRFLPVNGNLNIYQQAIYGPFIPGTSDLIAVVEGVTSLDGIDIEPNGGPVFL